MTRHAGSWLLALSCACVAAAVPSAAAHGSGPQRFAPIPRDDAVREARYVERTWPPPLAAEYEPFPRPARVLSTIRDTASSGEHAWLTMFRFTAAAEKDGGCVWVWRAEGRATRFEEAPTIAYGRGRLHDRCLARLTAAHVFGPDDEVGDDERIVYADPEPETPFGPLARGAYLGYPESMTDASIAGIPARFPRGSLGKTVGLSGFVIDDARTRIVRGAEIWIWPSTASSGHFVGTPRAPAYAIRAQSDGLGSFSLTELPANPCGYDILVRAPGFGDGYETHALAGPPDTYLGDLALERGPSFHDDSEDGPRSSARCG